MTPGDVLDVQRSVYEGLRFPPEFVTAFFDRFFEEETLEKLNTPELSDALGPWLQMFMPTTNGRDFLAMVRKPLYGAPSYQVDLRGDRGQDHPPAGGGPAVGDRVHLAGHPGHPLRRQRHPHQH
jgi:hypothetical protein